MSLEVLKEDIQNSLGTDDRFVFCSLFGRTRWLLRLSDLQLAQIFEIGRPTVERWATAQGSPHPVGFKPILSVLLEMVSNELRTQ